MNLPAIVSARDLTKLTFCLLSLCALTCQGFGADSGNMNLSPNAYIQLDFPQLPETFFVKKTGTKIPTQITARLPSNYAADKKFPLFVFLAGGDGGKADRDAIGSPYTIIGDVDYIRVTLPLFKKSLDPQTDIKNELTKELPPGVPQNIVEGLKKMATNGIIMGGDYETISSSYAVMLKKLYETIPNIDPQRSVLVGFSNGAHTIGVLLEKKDPFILEHFHSFCLIEGGMEMMINPKETLTEELKNHRFLVLYGEGGKDEKGNAASPRPYIFQIVNNYVQQARTRGFDFSLEVMSNTGHSFNPEYRPVLKQWALGGSVPLQPNSTLQTPSPTPATSQGGVL